MSPGAFTLWQRELVRFFRQRSRVVGALGSPAIFWLLLGSGFG
jgi:ABC-2 type transport system permease protein